ncbi:MAG: phenylalanine--tRNA ligase subunit beta, partial [Bacilli bacterium]
LRTHILHSSLKVASFNAARQNKDLALFETSSVQSLVSRSEHLALVLVGEEQQQGLMKKIPYDFYHLKGLVDGLMALLGIEESRYKYEKLVTHMDEFHPGKSAKITFQGKIIGVFGEIHPLKKEEYGFGKTAVLGLEINLSPLLEAKVSPIKMAPISRFPSIERDLAFIVNKDVLAKDIIRTIKMIGQGLVSKAQIFDVYEGQGIGENKKSIAVRVTYRSDNHTLSDKEVINVQDKIKFELTKAYQAELRS